MKDYMKDFDVPGKHQSKSALQKWRDAVSMVKNPRRRFRHVADLAKGEIHPNRFNKMERHVSLELAKANSHTDALASMKSRYSCIHEPLNTSNAKPLEEDADDEDKRYLTSLWVFGSRDIHGPESPQPPIYAKSVTEP
uniref:NIN-like protein n=1 Tax=Tanacetum cinerariifolium TaxID=118510 RepID=A0A699KB05_TANCI|nr:NIN-like protein [Tanacetum cinerariifolium]